MTRKICNTLQVALKYVERVWAGVCVFYTCGCSPTEILIANQLLRQVAREQAKMGEMKKKWKK